MAEIFKDSSLASSALRDMNEYRKSEDHRFCDWTLKTLDGAQFLVHKIVIASACPYFKCLFNSSLCESKDDVNGITLKNISSNSLEYILDYIYTGEIKIEVSNAMEIFESASYLVLEKLREFAGDFLEKCINDENCLSFWRFAETFDYEKLIKKSLDYILENAKNLLTKSFIEKLNFDEIKSITENSKLNCSEEEVFDAIIYWLQMDYENREKYTAALINQIRITRLSKDFITSNVLDCELLHTSQAYLMKIDEICKIRKQFDQGQFILHNSIIPRIGTREKSFLFLNNFEYYVVYMKYISYLLKKGLVSNTMKFCLKNSAKTVFKENFLLVSGLQDNYDKCQYFCPIRDEWRYFPSMKEGRECHGTTFLNDKIYACGGIGKDTIEYFDLSKENWFFGPKFSGIRSDFGVCSDGDYCIYAVGGEDQLIEQLDVREGKWNQIATTSTTTKQFVKTCFYRNSLYCMANNGGEIFELRKNKWNDHKIPQPLPNVEKFDICIEDSNIYCYLFCVFNGNLNSSISCYKINGNGIWEKGKRFFHEGSLSELTEFKYDIGIVTMYK